jgi:tRNA1Val (adenine37-N6)-methyltransferase
MKLERNIFRFKQFSVDQSGCAMKINTDGVLLGTMASHHQPEKILDIGTGTGVIALMLAQRYSEAKVQAVEIDEQAAATATRNFNRSIFNERLTANHISIEDYHSNEKFDLIVSNPPFFVNDYKNAERKKEIARHASDVFFDNLVKKVAGLLSENGCFWFILPIKQADDLMQNSRNYKLFPQRIVKLHSDVSKPAFRQVVCLGREEKSVSTEEFIIYESEKKYTKAYEYLLKDFFLAY